MNQLEETLDQALDRISALEPVRQHWTDLYFTSEKIGHVFENVPIYDDIETLKRETPDELPKMTSIEAQFANGVGNWTYWGFKVNYEGFETEQHSAKSGEWGSISGEANDEFVFEEGDYIVEAGGSVGWSMDSFWFKTKNGHERNFGSPQASQHQTCDTSGASNPMIIGFGMQDHSAWDTMQAVWCHYIDLDDFEQ